MQGKRKTTLEHQRDGTYRADRHAPKIPSVAFRNGQPVKPDDLPPDGSRLWDDVVEQTPPQLLCEIDWASLHQLCRWFAISEQLTKCLQDDPLEVKLYGPANTAARNFITLAGKFGLTPLDRSRTRVDTSRKTPASPLEQLKTFKVS